MLYTVHMPNNTYIYKFSSFYFSIYKFMYILYQVYMYIAALVLLCAFQKPYVNVKLF